MNRSLLLLALLLSAAQLVSAGPAQAWASANRFGGSSFHGWGESGHTNTWGGSTEHVAGEGTEHTNAYGGSTAHAYGGGTEHTNMDGGSTYGGYPAYHPPVAVPYYGSSGCYGCAAAAGAIVGATAATAASAAAAPVAVAPMVVGGSYAMLPPGAVEVSRFGSQYYLSGNTWYQPVYGANGVYYRVVPTP